jgi:hypothetical protein
MNPMRAFSGKGLIVRHWLYMGGTPMRSKARYRTGVGLVVTDRKPGLSAHPSLPNAWVWNPASMPFAETCKKIGVTGGKIAVSGGGGVFGLFLKIGFDTFHLSRVGKLLLPGGRPVFPDVPAKTPEQVLTEHGLKPDPVKVFDGAEDVTLVSWRR